MYERILLAYDGSAEGRAALREGALLAKQCDAQVFLLCVVAESTGSRMAEGAFAGVVGRMHEIHEVLFEEGMTRLRQMGFHPVGQLVIGDAPQEISAYAARISADLVIVGHRRQSMLDRWWSGSANAFLSDKLHCSLLISRRVISDDEFEARLEQGAPPHK